MWKWPIVVSAMRLKDMWNTLPTTEILLLCWRQYNNKELAVKCLLWRSTCYPIKSSGQPYNHPRTDETGFREAAKLPEATVLRGCSCNLNRGLRIRTRMEPRAWDFTTHRALPHVSKWGAGHSNIRPGIISSLLRPYNSGSSLLPWCPRQARLISPPIIMLQRYCFIALASPYPNLSSWRVQLKASLLPNSLTNFTLSNLYLWHEDLVWQSWI